MRHRYHSAGPVVVRGEVDPAVRCAVEAAVLAGLERVLGAATGPGGAPARSPSPLPQARPRPQERSADGRVVAAGAGYSVPSYDDHGRPVDLPVLPRDPDRPDGGESAAPAAAEPPRDAGTAGLTDPRPDRAPPARPPPRRPPTPPASSR